MRLLEEGTFGLGLEGCVEAHQENEGKLGATGFSLGTCMGPGPCSSRPAFPLHSALLTTRTLESMLHIPAGDLGQVAACPCASVSLSTNESDDGNLFVGLLHSFNQLIEARGLELGPAHRLTVEMAVIVILLSAVHLLMERGTLDGGRWGSKVSGRVPDASEPLRKTGLPPQAETEYHWPTLLRGQIYHPVSQKGKLRPRGGSSLEGAKGSGDDALATGGRRQDREKWASNKSQL